MKNNVKPMKLGNSEMQVEFPGLVTGMRMVTGYSCLMIVRGKFNKFVINCMAGYNGA